ncbi:unnamed protein product, partial [Mesorhabditis spiculigera]
MADAIRAGLENAAQTFAAPGIIKHFDTSFGQKYVLYGKPVDGLYELWMVTANARNIEVISRHLKLSQRPMDLGALGSMMQITEKHFASRPIPNFSQPPPSCLIPTGSELLSFSKVDLSDGSLLPGDEIFIVCYLPSGEMWHHSGIHLGGGWYCHFVPNHGYNADDLLNGRTVSGSVRCDSAKGFINAFPSEHRQTFRVTHPILVREGLEIVEHARRFMDQQAFGLYDYRLRNAQHFSSLCSYGIGFSYDAEKLYGFKNQVAGSRVATVVPMVPPHQNIHESSKDALKHQSAYGSHYVGGPMAFNTVNQRQVVSQRSSSSRGRGSRNSSSSRGSDVRYDSNGRPHDAITGQFVSPKRLR